MKARPPSSPALTPPPVQAEADKRRRPVSRSCNRTLTRAPLAGLRVRQRARPALAPAQTEEMPPEQHEGSQGDDPRLALRVAGVVAHDDDTFDFSAPALQRLE